MWSQASSCEANVFDGFTVFVEQGCFEKHPRLLAQISGDMAEISRLLPEHALTLLRNKAAIWINDVLKYPDEEKESAGACCHWGTGWVVGNKGDHPAKGSCCEIYSAKQYIDWVASQPSIVLHELSHAYHCHRVSEVDSIIQNAYKAAMASGVYASGEYMGQAQAAKPYGATNANEFFAESSEAFWSSQRFRNDFFPYVHCELKSFDPIGYKMCEDVWGISGSEVISRAEFPSDWLHKMAKVPEQEPMTT